MKYILEKHINRISNNTDKWVVIINGVFGYFKDGTKASDFYDSIKLGYKFHRKELLPPRHNVFARGSNLKFFKITSFDPRDIELYVKNRGIR